MKPSVVAFSIALFSGLLSSAAPPARAAGPKVIDLPDEPQLLVRPSNSDAHAATVRVRFASRATTSAIADAACSIAAVGLFGGKARAFDVHVDGRRCSHLAAEDGAIPLYVGTESRADSGRAVVLEADVGSDVRAGDLRAAVARTAEELKNRLSPRPHPAEIAVIDEKPTPAPMASPGLYAFGLSFAIIGGVAVAAGAVVGIGTLISAGMDSASCSLNHAFISGSNCHTDASAGGDAALTLLAVGAGFVLVGGIAITVGGRKVAEVSAYAAPTGGGLRVVF
jgi:hypothetical protein